MPDSPRLQQRGRTVSERAIRRDRRRAERSKGPAAPPQLPPLPKRSECRTGPRPCPHVRCRYHLGVDVQPNGSLRECADWQQRETCALDVADHNGAQSLEQVSAHFGVTRERVRQLELRALGKLRLSLEAGGLSRDEVKASLAELHRPSFWDGGQDLHHGELVEMKDAAKRVTHELDEGKSVMDKRREWRG